MDQSNIPVGSTPPQDMNSSQPSVIPQSTPIPIDQPISTEVVQPVKTKVSKKLILGILIGVGVFIALFVSIFLFVSSATAEPFKASNDFLSGLDNGDAQTLYNTTSTEFQEVVTLSEFQTFYEKYKVLPFSEAKVIGKHIETTSDESIATFTYTLSYNSETYQIETQMIKVGEDWKLIVMQVE